MILQQEYNSTVNEILTTSEVIGVSRTHRIHIVDRLGHLQLHADLPLGEQRFSHRTLHLPAKGS